MRWWKWLCIIRILPLSKTEELCWDFIHHSLAVRFAVGSWEGDRRKEADIIVTVKGPFYRHFILKEKHTIYSSSPLSVGGTFQWMPGTVIVLNFLCTMFFPIHTYLWWSLIYILGIGRLKVITLYKIEKL